MTEETRQPADFENTPASQQAEPSDSEPALPSTTIFWRTTPDGTLDRDHPEWRALTGQSLEEIKGFGWTNALHPEDVSRVQQAWQHAVASKNYFITEYRVKRTDGNYRLFEVRGIPVFDGDAIREWVGTLIDITDQREAERRTNEVLNALLSLAEALVLPDVVNLPAELILGPTFDPAVRPLALLTCRALGCRGVSLLALASQDEVLVPVGIVGQPEYRQQWWHEQEQQKNQLSASFTDEQLGCLLANELVIIDHPEPQPHPLLAPNLARFALVAPMKIRDQLIGLLILDQGETAHHYSPQELAMIRAIARLTAMVIERNRLLEESARAQGAEIAHRDAIQQMEAFLGIASHELKTPLTSIDINLQMSERLLNKLKTEKTTHSDDAQKIDSPFARKLDTLHEHVHSAKEQVDLLNRLVSDLVDVSRIQNHKLQLHMRSKRCDLATIVHEAVQTMRHIHRGRILHLVLPTVARRQRLPLPMGGDAMLVPIDADPDRIGQVVKNYLTNALRYAPSGTTVMVEVQVEDDHARVSVRDEGPGLSQEQQTLIWERFYQGENSQGLGLGLYISHSIIDWHHGEIGVQSDLGHGSTFWFTLPLARD